MNNSGKLFADELIEWLLEAGFIQSQCQMSIYYKYAPDGSKNIVLSYVDDCVYWYTNEDLGISFPKYQQNIFQYLHLYTNIHNYQHKIKQYF